MNKEFVTYEQALALKELGFDEPCFCIYNREKVLRFNNLNNPNDRNKGVKLTSNNGRYPAPTFSQAFRWFREKHGLHQYIKQYYGEKFYFHIEDMVHPRRWDEYTVEMLRSFNESTSQEEAELACLKQLIKTVNELKGNN